MIVIRLLFVLAAFAVAVNGTKSNRNRFAALAEFGHEEDVYWNPTVADVKDTALESTGKFIEFNFTSNTDFLVADHEDVILNDIERDHEETGDTEYASEIPTELVFPNRRLLKELIRKLAARMKVSEFTGSFLSVPELDVENMPKIRFSEFMERANTGDILLFSAGDSISKLIRRFTRSPINTLLFYSENGILVI